jgi:hypothetical protein
MGLRELLDRLETMPVPLVPSQSSPEGTSITQCTKGGSLCSLSSPEIFTSQWRSTQLIRTQYACGYYPPFCSCGFYKFPNKFEEKHHG